MSSKNMKYQTLFSLNIKENIIITSEKIRPAFHVNHLPSSQFTGSVVLFTMKN